MHMMPNGDVGEVSGFDRIAPIYDLWARNTQDDVSFYVEEARRAGGVVVEFGVGTGRIAVPVAQAGIRVIGIDRSKAMLAICRERAKEAGVGERLDLRCDDFRNSAVDDPVKLVTCPFRGFWELATDQERLNALDTAFKALLPGGRLVFDVYSPTGDPPRRGPAVWHQVAPGIWQRGDWCLERRTLTLSMRGEDWASSLQLFWISPDEWEGLLKTAGFVVEACYGWFDRGPAEGVNTVWVATRPHS